MLLRRKIRQNVGDIVYNKNIYKNDEDKVRIIGDYFAEQVTNDEGIYDNDINYEQNYISENRYHFPEITKNMFMSILKNLDIHTANGPDNISNIY